MYMMDYSDTKHKIRLCEQWRTPLIAERISARHCIAHSGQDRLQDLYICACICTYDVCIYVCISHHTFRMQLILREAHVFGKDR